MGITTSSIVSPLPIPPQDLQVYPLQYTNAESLVLMSNDSEQGTSELAYTKLKTLTITKFNFVPPVSQIKIYFELKSLTAAPTASARIYVNGVAVGTERNSASNVYAAYSESITAVQGDSIQIYAKATGGVQAYIQNMRLLGSFVPPFTISNP